MGTKLTLSLNKAIYAEFETSNELREHLSNRGYSVFSWQDSPGARYSEHHHDHNEVIVVFKGAIKFTIAGNDYLLEAGDELILPAGTKHSAVNSGEITCQYFICS